MTRYKFIVTEEFVRQYKKLKKTNKRLSDEFDQFLKHFDHSKGAVISNTGGARKIRMKGSGRGKSGAYRVIYYLLIENKIFFLTI
ncbi:MAG: hypothetical protein ACE5HO_08095 [bacterium]